MSRFFARKASCKNGHTHASITEAKRCDQLHEKQAAGEIISLRTEPRFTFVINDREVKMRNGQVMRYTGDFTYIQGNRQVVEEVKARNGWMSRDVPIKLALMAACYPDIDLRIVK